MPRLTRAQSQARTRQELITTARTVFLTEGYLAASVDTVAETAGYSRGAVYSNFGGKERLCLAVLQDLLAEEAAQLLASIGTPAGVEEFLDALGTWAQRKVGEPGWTLLTLDFAAAAHQDPHLSGELDALLAGVRATIASAIEDLTGRLRLSPALPAARIAEALLGLIIGLGTQRLLDPRIPVTTLTATLRALLTPAIPD